MNSEKKEILIIGLAGSLFGLMKCMLGIWLYSLETSESTTTYIFFGITLKGKVLAAIVTWAGIVLLFYSIRKLVKPLPVETDN